MKLYTVELLDNNGNRLAILENTKAPTYTRRRNQATQVSFSVPRSDDKTSLIQLATRFNLYRRGSLLFGGVITKRNLSKDPWTFEGFSREIDLDTMLTPAYWTWRDKDLADIFRDLTFKFKTKRWAQKADFEIGQRENVDTTTMPGNVILQKGEDNHYPASGYITSGIIDLVTGNVYAPPNPPALIPSSGGDPASFTRSTLAIGRHNGGEYAANAPRYEDGPWMKPANIITSDPGFETGVGGFVFSPDVTGSSSDDWAWDGSRSLKLVTDGSNQWGQAFRILGNYAGKRVNASIYAYTPTGSTVRVEFYGENIGFLNGKTRVMTAGEIYRFDIEQKVPIACKDLRLYLRPSYGIKAVKEVYFDKLVVNISYQAVLVEGSMTNLDSADPSFESGTNGFAPSPDVAVSSSTDWAFAGNKSLKVVTNGSNQWAQLWKTYGDRHGQTLTATIYARTPEASRVRIEFYDETHHTFLAGVTRDMAAGEVYRFEVTQAVPDDCMDIRLYLRPSYGIAAAKTVYFDAVMVTQSNHETSWHPSTRAAESLTVPLAGMSPAAGTWEQWVYIDAVARRQGDGYNRIFEIPRSVGGFGITVWHDPTSAYWYLATQDNAGTRRYASFADAVTPDGWHLFKVAWTASTARLYIDNVLRGSIDAPPLPSAFAPSGYVGSENGAANFLDSLHACVRLSSVARFDENANLTQPLPSDKDTIGLWLFDGNLAEARLAALSRFERIRWAEQIGTKVRHTVQFRASDLREYAQWPDWSPELTPEIDPAYGVDLVHLGLSTIHRYAEIRFNLYTDDTETPHQYEEGTMPSAYGFTPILGPFELIWRESSGLSADGIPSSLGIAVMDYRADHGKHLAVAADLAEKYGVEFRVEAAGALTVAKMLGEDHSGEIIVAAEHNVNIEELGDALADVVNVLTVLGAGEGIAQLQTELRDEDSIRAYGERCGVVTNKDIYDWADLLEWGAAELAKRARPDWKFKVRLVGIPDYWPEFGLGDTITAVHPKLGIRVQARILEEQRKEDNGEVITLGLNSELDVAVRKFFRAIAEKEALVPRETVPLPAPTGLVAEGRISEAVLQWVHAGADTYEIFHSYDGEEFSLIDTVPGTQKTYTHKALGIRTGHYYKVRAVKDGIPSALSQVAYAFVDRLAGTAIETSSMPASVFDIPLAGMIGRMGRNRILSGLQMQQPAFMRYELPAVQDATVRYLDTGIATDHNKNEAAYHYYIKPFPGGIPHTLIRIPYIRWDLSGVTGNVISAQISLYCNGKDVNSPNYWPKLCKVLGGWDEATITYNNKPSFEHIISIPLSHISVGRVLITDPSILSLVYGWLNGTIQNHGICIDMNTGGNMNFVSFATRHEAQTYQPLLILETQQSAVDRIVRVSSGIVKIANNFYYVPAFEIEAPDDTTSYLSVTMESEGVFSHQFKPTPDLGPNDVGIGKVTAAGGVLTEVEMSVAAGRIDGAFDWGAFGLSGTYGDLPDSAGLVYVGEFRPISTTVPASWTHNMGTGMLLAGMLFKDNAGTILQMCSIAVNNSSAGITVDMSDPNVITATATSAGVHYDKVNNMTYTQGLVAPIFLAIGQGL